MKVLCVAEKPSISKAVATHLAGGRVETVRSICLYTSLRCPLTQSVAQYEEQIHQELLLRL